MSGDTIRDELAAKVRARIDDWRIACDPADDHGPSLDDAIVDAVLDWLGGLDPDCDRDLLVWHLRNDRDRIAKLTDALRECEQQRQWAERCVGSLPLEIGEQFDRASDRAGRIVSEALAEAQS